MAEWIPQPQLPSGLAAQNGQMAMQNAQIIPQAIQNALANVFAGLQKRHELQQQMLSPEQAQAIAGGMPPTMPGQPLANGAIGPVQPIQTSSLFPNGMNMGALKLMGDQIGASRFAQAAGIRNTGMQSLEDQKAEHQKALEALKAQHAKELADAKLNAPVDINDADKENYKIAYGKDLDKNMSITAAQRKQIADAAKAKTTAAASSGKGEEKQWQMFAKDANPAQASSRTLIGTAASVNTRADRALTSLSSKTMTNEQAAGVAADIAGILKGATPDEQAMKEQGYGTLYSKAMAMKQYLTGKPQDAVPDAIKAKLRETIMELKGVDNEIIKNHHDSLKVKYQPLLQKDPARAGQMLDSLMKTTQIAGQGKAKPGSGDPLDSLIDKHLAQ